MVIAKYYEANEYDFKNRYDFSKVSTSDIEEMLSKWIPNIERIDESEYEGDYKGADYWVWIKGDWPLAIDSKKRELDCRNFGNDDVALETWSICELKIGWTLDKEKITDYVLFYWEDTGRYLLVPFRPLFEIFNRCHEEWRKLFGYAKQRTPNRSGEGGYHSECIFVPRKLIVEKLIENWEEVYEGSLKRKER